MENKGLINPQDIQIQGVIDRYCRSKVSSDNSIASDHHLDEDSLTAFTEGNLSQREAQPIVSHLVDCSFCRHITTELIRLDLAFAGEEIQAPQAAVENQPSKISEVFNNLLSRIFGTNDSAVFAHQEQENQEETKNHEESEDVKK